jgi:hypothetical protein
MNLFLAFSANSNALQTYAKIPWQKLDLGLLVSFYYLRMVRREWCDDCPRLMLDSGAFSAWKSGKEIDLAKLISEARRACWESVVALDVIGDGTRSQHNAHIMRNQVGSRVMPVFHIGEPLELLAAYCEVFERVGLSCRFGEPIAQSLAWLDRCFAHAYPHRFHSFGWMDDVALTAFPFDSADAVSWALGPSMYGNWYAFGNLPTRNSRLSLIGQVEHIADQQARLRAQWAKERERWTN